jgi:hypothetical protein
MRQYVRLCEDQRNSRRAIADAIDVLCMTVGFTETDRGQIHIGLLDLASAQPVGLVQVLFDHPSNDSVYVVSLPTSRHFRAWDPNASRYRRFEIQKLDSAKLHGIGRVVLADGLPLRAVEVIRASLPIEPSELDWRIVHGTIALIGSQERCYRSLRSQFPSEGQEMVLDLWFLDCSKLSGLNVPFLRNIAAYMGRKYPTDRPPSEQKIADALDKFGVRPPRQRGRRAAR